jgi:ASPM-SPD-2-Hydin domain-containing protein
MAAEVSTCGNPLSLLVLVFSVAALIAQIGCVGATAKTTSSGSTTSSNSNPNSNQSSAYVISAAPTALSFVAAVNGSAPAAETATFIATPATPLPFTMTATQPWITMSASSGVTKSTIQFGVNTTGMAVGTYSGQVVVTPTGAGNPPMTIPVSLTISTATPGTLSASVGSLSFNGVNVGSNSTLQATLTNTGSASVDISNVSISGAGFSASGVPAGTILGAGQSATLNVTFTPSSAGNLTGGVTISSNASDSTDSIFLSGTGVQNAQHSVVLNWQGSSTVAGYNEYQSTNSAGSFAKLNPSLVNTQSYTDNSVQAGQTYYYVVTSVNSSGVESGYSNEVSVTVPLS